MKLGVMTDHRVREDYSRDSVAVIDVIANSEDDNTWVCLRFFLIVVVCVELFWFHSLCNFVLN